LLQSYLNTIRDDGTAEPLSVKLRQLQPHSEQKLVEHLYQLANAKPAASTLTTNN
jgi:hypothetical protein